MIVRGLVCSAALLAAAGCASSAEVAAASAEQGGGEIVCREILAPGSNVLQTVCDTREGWEAYERARRRDTQELFRRMRSLSGS